MMYPDGKVKVWGSVWVLEELQCSDGGCGEICTYYLIAKASSCWNTRLIIDNNDDLLQHCSNKDKRMSYRLETAQQVSVSGHWSASAFPAIPLNMHRHPR